jgi:hypothetical protein
MTHPSGLALACAGAALAWSATFSASAAARGPTSDPDAPPAPPRNQWSIGLGVSLAGPWLGGAAAGTAGTAGMALPLPHVYTTSLEYRVGDATWLLLRGAGNGAIDSDGTTTARGLTLSGSLGVRQVLNPEDRFQVSLYGRGGGAYAYGDQGDGTGAKSRAALLEGGLSLEPIISDHFTLRLSMTALRAEYQVYEAAFLDAEGALASYESDHLGGGFGFEPELEVRFAW